MFCHCIAGKLHEETPVEMAWDGSQGAVTTHKVALNLGEVSHPHTPHQPHQPPTTPTTNHTNQTTTPINPPTTCVRTPARTHLAAMPPKHRTAQVAHLDLLEKPESGLTYLVHWNEELRSKATKVQERSLAMHFAIYVAA